MNLDEQPSWCTRLDIYLVLCGNNMGHDIDQIKFIHCS